jgi:hypothetical protein
MHHGAPEDTRPIHMYVESRGAVACITFVVGNQRVAADRIMLTKVAARRWGQLLLEISGKLVDAEEELHGRI